MMVKTPAAASNPQSIPAADTVRVMTAEIGLALTQVSGGARSKLTPENTKQENIKQKNAATPMPLAINGTRILTKNRGNEYPSRKAVSSISRGTLETKPSRIQTASGTLKMQCASATAHGVSNRLIAE